MQYSTVLYFVEAVHPGYIPSWYPSALKGYLLAGGNVAVIGRNFAAPEYVRFKFLEEVFGISPTDVHPVLDTLFRGATGMAGFPDVRVDTTKLAFVGGHALNLVEFFDPVDPVRGVATYVTDPYRDSVEGKAVGLRAVDPGVNAYYFSFLPLALQFADAKAFVTKILNDFGETPTAVGDEAALP